MEYNGQVRNRVKRVEGQLRGILRMMEDMQDCKDVIAQLNAARAAIDRTVGVIVSNNLVDCLNQPNPSINQESLVKESIDLLVKSR